MSVLSNYLLDGKLTPTLSMSSKPNQAEPTPSQQFHFLKSIRKTISECSFLLFGEAKALVRPYWIASLLFFLFLSFDSFNCHLLFCFPLWVAGFPIELRLSLYFLSLLINQLVLFAIFISQADIILVENNFMLLR